METRIIPMDDPQALTQAISYLWAGEIVAFPTETSYALAACATMPAAVNKMFVVKGRQRSRGMPLFIHTVRDLARIADPVPPVAYELAKRFWPGALALVLRRSSRVPAAVSAGQATVSVRMPAHRGALTLLKAAACPLVVAGANLAHLPGPLMAVDVALQLSGRIPLILDGGRCTGGLDSTVLDLTGNQPCLVRLGPLGVAALRSVIPELVEGTEVVRAEYARVR